MKKPQILLLSIATVFILSLSLIFTKLDINLPSLAASVSQTELDQNTQKTWYENLKKPNWSPDASIFGPVWSVLYILIIISFGFIFWQFVKGKLSFSLILPFILNLFFNLIFTYIQFGLKNNVLAFVDIVLVLITLAWGMIVVYHKHKWVSYIQIPYLLWVSFATILQVTITILNL